VHADMVLFTPKTILRTLQESSEPQTPMERTAYFCLFCHHWLRPCTWVIAFKHECPPENLSETP
jgi:hypothetical protein